MSNLVASLPDALQDDETHLIQMRYDWQKRNYCNSKTSPNYSNFPKLE